MTKRIVLALILGICMGNPHSAESACTKPRDHTRVADFGKRYMPFTAYGISAYHQDWLGLGMSVILINGLYALNNPVEKKIGKKRPCGCKGAFPSGHMIVYASTSSYLHYRYGWQYGLPAYIASVAFAYDRVRNKAHGWDDMLGTFAAVNLLSFLVVPRFNDKVEYLPQSWVKQREEARAEKLRYTHNLTHYEKSYETIPMAFASKKSVIAGFSLKF